MTRIERHVQHFRRQRRWTLEVVAAVPEERFAWAPSATAFTCGGLVVHLIQSELFWRKLLVAASRGEVFDPFAMSGPVRERLIAFREPNLAASATPRFGSTFAECVRSWEPIAEKTAAELGAIPEDRLDAVEFAHPLSGLEASLEEMFVVFFTHEAHHRGQLSAYLKTLGLESPPIFT